MIKLSDKVIVSNYINAFRIFVKFYKALLEVELNTYMIL